MTPSLNVLLLALGDLLIFTFALGLAVFLRRPVLYLIPLGGLAGPKTNLLLTMVIAYVLCFYWRRMWLDLISSDGFAKKVCFIGRQERFASIKTDMVNRQYSEYKSVNPDTLRHIAEAAASPRRDSRAAMLLKRRADMLVIDTETLPDPLAEPVVRLAAASGLPIWDYCDFYEKFYQKVPLEEAARGAWILTYRLKREELLYLRAKRLADFAAAAIAITLIAPFFAIIAIAMKLADGGTIFYRQERTGYMGRPFMLWKLRTMVPGADRQVLIHKADNRPDPRITRAGAVLRKYRLDELPQLLNILNGDMSFVGPRPLWTGEKQALEVPGFHLRHMVRPGLTGWAQIYASAANTTQDITEKLRYDLYYVKNIALSLDIAIVLKTLKRVFQTEHAMRRRNIVDTQPL